jgi:hypothetical protein
MRRLVLTWLLGMTLGVPAVCSGQIYAGAAVGVGGASLPIGSYGTGFRGMLRLFGGYAFTPQIAAEAMTFDLGTPGDRPGDESTIGAFAVAAVGTWPVRRWRFTGRLGAMSMDGRALGKTTRSGQGMLGVGVGFEVIPSLTIGLETSTSRVRFSAPIDDTVRVNWTALAASYRF